MESQEPIQNPQNSIPPESPAPVADNPGPRKLVKKEGRVIEALPNAFFKVVLDDGKEVMGFLSGKMRLNRIKILLGDKVTLEMSEYDMGKGRIVYRLK
jgi:translation initiation factor IF-1